MMRILQPAELARMRMAQESAMMDTCVLMRYGETFDPMHHPVPSWTDGPVLACGLNMSGGEELSSDGRVLVSWTASLRLPAGTLLDVRDRVRMVLRFGQVCEQIIYDLAGPAQEGPSGLVARLRATNPRVHG